MHIYMYIYICIYVYIYTRQDSATSLPSDLGRHYNDAVLAASQARTQADQAALQAAEADWAARRADAMGVARQGGCFSYLTACWTLPRMV